MIQAMLAMADELQKVQKKHESMNFKAAAEEYIETKRNILSPTSPKTVRNYHGFISTVLGTFYPNLMN